MQFENNSPELIGSRKKSWRCQPDKHPVLLLWPYKCSSKPQIYVQLLQDSVLSKASDVGLNRLSLWQLRSHNGNTWKHLVTYAGEKHCAHFRRGPNIFKKGAKGGPDFEQKGDLKGTNNLSCSKRSPRGPRGLYGHSGKSFWNMQVSALTKLRLGP